MRTLPPFRMKPWLPAAKLQNNPIFHNGFQQLSHKIMLGVRSLKFRSRRGGDF